MMKTTCSNIKHKFLQEAESILFYTALVPQSFKSTEMQLLWELQSGFSLQETLGKLLEKLCLTVTRHR